MNNKTETTETMIQARALWQLVETIHAVTYFAAESTAASAHIGVRGFWRTYFGYRAAPLGRCSAATVTATFFGFAPAFVERAVPDIWTLAEPEAFLTARATSAAAALRRVAPAIDQLAESDEVVAMLEIVAAAAAPAGRPLYAANRATPVRADPVERLWQTCTTLREQRGDGHVTALVAAGLAAPDVDRLRIAETGEPAELLLTNRGWTDHAWAEAESLLQQQGLIDRHGITTHGVVVRANIERVTDTLAASALAELTNEQRRSLLRQLTPVVHTIATSNLIPYPNPIGLTQALGSHVSLW